MTFDWYPRSAPFGAFARLAPFAVAGVILAACGGASSSSSTDPSLADAGAAGSGGDDAALPMTAPDGGAADASVDGFLPSGKCADAFGSELTAGFGRIDGTIYAVQKPSDTTCTFPNSDHVVLQC